VQALQQAKADGALASRFEVDALPQPGRTYDRGPAHDTPENGEELPANSDDPQIQVATPLPDLYGRQR
jgi:hypothetical protein